MKDLTFCQRETLQYIYEYQQCHAGQPPSVREIALECGLGGQGAGAKRLKPLIRKGLVIKSYGCRAITVSEAGKHALGVPVSIGQSWETIARAVASYPCIGID